MYLKGRLIGEYRILHAIRPKRYSKGSTLRKYIEHIRDLVAEIPTETILDYGCGKGTQYTIDRMHEAWGIMPTLFDPGVAGIDKLPEGKFDGVICTGVLEHIPEKEIDRAIGNLANYASKWCFIIVGTKPSKKTLPGGRGVHVTLQSKEWWRARIDAGFRDKGIEVRLGFLPE